MCLQQAGGGQRGGEGGGSLRRNYGLICSLEAGQRKVRFTSSIWKSPRLEYAILDYASLAVQAGLRRESLFFQRLNKRKNKTKTQKTIELIAKRELTSRKQVLEDQRGEWTGC